MAETKKKKVKKHVVDAIAHIHASFNNTIIQSPIVKEMHYLGQHQVVVVFVAQENQHLLQLK